MVDAEKKKKNRFIHQLGLKERSELKKKVLVHSKVSEASMAYHRKQTFSFVYYVYYRNLTPDPANFVDDYTKRSQVPKPFPSKPRLLFVCNTRLLKTLCEKEKLLVTSNFSSSHSVFNLFGDLSIILFSFKIVVCTFLQFGRVLIFLVRESVNWNWIGFCSRKLMIQHWLVWERVKQACLALNVLPLVNFQHIKGPL